MVTITVLDREGNVHRTTSPGGESLMHCIRDAGLPMLAVCGGGISCGTCHVYVEGNWPLRLPPPLLPEQKMLEALQSCDPDRSRLACQIEIEPALDGLVIRLGPNE